MALLLNKETNMTKIAVIYGSSRPSSAGEVVANYFANTVELPAGVELDLIDLAEVNLPMIADPIPPIANQYELESTKAWSKQITQYDGYVFVVAEYNLGYTPILKNAIDTLFHEWNKKAAALISYGSYPTSNAAEQLKQVLRPFKMKVVDPSLHVSPISEAVSDEGKLDPKKVSGDSPQAIIKALVAVMDES